MAIVFHEVAHGWVAHRLGDSTAARMGRLTLNPISHIDLFGTVLLPLVLIVVRAPFVFGYAKPVPVNFHNLNHPKRDMIWVAAAGPATNILLALISVYLLKFVESAAGSSFALPGFVSNPLMLMVERNISINVMLAAFNLLPIPPLDGGRVLVGLTPEPFSSAIARIEPYGFLILIFLLMTDLVGFFMSPLIYFVVQLLRALVVGW
ncbi:MAG: site-2 protease family protein [Candidatus Binatia bacterium]